MPEAGFEANTAVSAESSTELKSEPGPMFTLGPRDTLEGKLTYEGSIRIEGRAEGELHVTGELEVAHGAMVKASLDAATVAVEGEVEGTVIARKKLSLSGSGRLNGDVHVGRLQVSDGATLNGNVRMGGSE